MDGYCSHLYAQSLAEFGAPVHLAASNGWLLERPVADTEETDLIGCYPLFRCADWSRLHSDLDGLAGRAVSVSMVVDPFCGLDKAALATCFPDVCRPFKEHAVVDFAQDWRTGIGRHHRRNIRAAAHRVEVERCPDPIALLPEWSDLYANLIERHGIRGIAKFSTASFAQQLRVPGAVAFRGVCENQTVGMLLWFRSADVAYYHLGAFSPLGYGVGAAFALFYSALNHFAKEGVRWAELGGAAGWQSPAEDGLARFKQGWSNGRIAAWFCGRVLAPESYRRLVAMRRLDPTEYFPAYRRPEAA